MKEVSTPIEKLSTFWDNHYAKANSPWLMDFEKVPLPLEERAAHLVYYVLLAGRKLYSVCRDPPDLIAHPCGANMTTTFVVEHCKS